jgi:hypothetical protein
MAARQKIQKFLVTRTGLGEFLFHSYLAIRSPSYRQKPGRNEDWVDDTRYVIEGGEDYAENVVVFRKYETDALVLDDHFSEETEVLFRNYVVGLEEFASICSTEGADCLFVYFPAYSQVYDTTAPRYVNDRFRAACDSLGIHFLDLTDGFREKGRGKVLHLAPLDFHLNPKGNTAFAELVADYLTGEDSLATQIGQWISPSGED